MHMPRDKTKTCKEKSVFHIDFLQSKKLGNTSLYIFHFSQMSVVQGKILNHISEISVPHLW